MVGERHAGEFGDSAAGEEASAGQQSGDIGELAGLRQLEQVLRVGAIPEQSDHVPGQHSGLEQLGPRPPVEVGQICGGDAGEDREGWQHIDGPGAVGDHAACRNTLS